MNDQTRTGISCKGILVLVAIVSSFQETHTTLREYSLVSSVESQSNFAGNMEIW